jgi:hypothetical protein
VISSSSLAEAKPGKARVNECDIPATLPANFAVQPVDRWNGQNDFGKKSGADSKAGTGGEWWSSWPCVR